MVGAKLEDVGGAGLAKVGEGFVEVLEAIGLLGIRLTDEAEQASFHDVESGEGVFGGGWAEE